MDSIIRLFKAVPITSSETKISSESLLKKTVEKGFLFAPEVVFNYREQELEVMITKIEKEVGLSGEQMNSSFHKSWSKVKDSPLFQLVIEQCIHYLTTYGFEQLGIYDKDSVYIPNEKLEIPELEGNITLTIIKGYTKEQLKRKLLDLLNQGIALADDTMKDVVDVALFVDLNETEIERTRNKETKIVLYDYLGKVPESPIEFLRFIVYKATEKTLLIKNKETITAIKSKQNIAVLRYFHEYEKKHGLAKLAEIFFRFKPLFLAFKTNSQLKPVINRIRKLANTHHKPMVPDYLNDVTMKIKQGQVIDEKTLMEELEKANTFRKVRLAYALNFRCRDVESILYRIRNGKAYAKSFSFDNKVEAERIYSYVQASIVEAVRKNVEGKKIFIPENVVYALPATEKQFTGDFPSGSCITVPKDMVVGIHWNNVGRNRIDLDLSMVNAIEKFGWDASYRDEGRNILFSGDQTDASNGASELYYVARQNDASYILYVNYYNSEAKVEVPFKILVATKDARHFGEHYMVNPNSVLCTAKTKITEGGRQKLLGLIVLTSIECKFYFSETSIGNTRTALTGKSSEHSRRYLYDFYTNAISLNKVLELAGAQIVTEKIDDETIDLSPQNLEKDKIIALLK